MPRLQLTILFIASVLVASTRSQLLYELQSPNEEWHGYFGHSGAILVDLNLDGYDEIAVGAYWEDAGSLHNSGRLYLFDGKSGDLFRETSSPNPQYSGHFGVCVANAGDVDNWGFDDLIVGAFVEDPLGGPIDAGRAYVFDGWSGDLEYTLVSPTPDVEGHFGATVAGAGALLGGGNEYVVVGAQGENPGSSPTDAGRVHIFKGWNGELFRTLSSPNEEADGKFGHSVAGQGDGNGDTADDIIVGADGEDPGLSPNDAGRAYLFDGLTGGLRYTLQAPTETANAEFGNDVSWVGDVTGDGRDDMLVGAPNAGSDGSGRVYVFSGATGSLYRILSSPHAEAGGRFGTAVANAGDVDGDGRDDVIIGAPLEGPDGSPQGAGRAYVFTWLVSPSGGQMIFELSSPNEEEDGRFGVFVAGGGDVNNDGFADVVVSAHLEDPGQSPEDAGRAYVFSPATIWATKIEDAVYIEWMQCHGAWFFWQYGADNEAYFEPGLSDPYEYRITGLAGSLTQWPMFYGVGDPDHNWTYLLVAVEAPIPHILWVSNRVGEFDYLLDIP